MRDCIVDISAISDFGRRQVADMGNPWRICMIADRVPFSKRPGPWMLLERNHFQRWVNVPGDCNFQVGHFRWLGRPH